MLPRLPPVQHKLLNEIADLVLNPFQILLLL